MFLFKGYNQFQETENVRHRPEQVHPRITTTTDDQTQMSIPRRNRTQIAAQSQRQFLLETV